jgi:hypothetical protein
MRVFPYIKTFAASSAFTLCVGSLLILFTAGTNIVAVGITCALSLTLGAVLQKLLKGANRAHFVVAGVAACLLILFYGLGARTQVTIDGQPVFERSETAQGTRQARSLESSLGQIAEADILFGSDISVVRAQLTNFDRQAEACATIARTWSKEEAVNAEFQSAIEAGVSAADLCAQTARRYIDAAETSDARIIESARELRVIYIDETLRAGRLLVNASDVTGVPLSVDGVSE